MNQRRNLIEGLKGTPAVDHDKEKAFILGEKAGQQPTVAASHAATAVQSPNRVAISTRMRGDFATALKRASLERQLAGVEPNTLTEMLEQAVEPWLRSNGYLK